MYMQKNRDRIVLGILIVLAVALAGWIAWKVMHGTTEAPIPKTPSLVSQSAPELVKEVVVDGLDRPWDIAFLPDETMLFTERPGEISKLAGRQKVRLAIPAGLVAKGEAGLMGLAVDPDFTSNRFVYACYATAGDVRLARWKVNADVTALTDQTNIVTGIPLNTRTFPGRHSGCRPRFGADGYLWVGTGDAAIGTNPQDPGLGGKILHVTRDGQPAPGNQNAPFDPRVYSYGHRNVQGLAMLPSPRYGVYGFSDEHGPTRDDEVTPLRSGNAGWNPVPGYNEAVPMSDKAKYPTVIDPIWRSGDSTIAPSGMTFLLGSKWGVYENRLAMAVLKDEHLRLLELDDQGKLKSEAVLFKSIFGRIRSAVTSPSGDLYLSTDNGGGQDKIIRVTPQ